MRGIATSQVTMLSALTPDELVPTEHPMRRIKPIAEAALRQLEATFSAMYAAEGRPSIPPEHLLKGCLLMALYTIRSERQFCERLQYDLLFKWFLDLNIEDPAFDHSSFAKNRQRLLDHDVARQFFAAVLVEAKRMRLLSSEHFTVDGTLLEAWASMKSVGPRAPNLGGRKRRGGKRGRNQEVDFRGQKRSNQTHCSSTDPEAMLARKSPNQGAKLAFAGHVLMENRNGLVVDVDLTKATGSAEREAGIKMMRRHKKSKRRDTLGADKGYDTKDFVTDCRAIGVTPHVAQNINEHRGSAIDERTANKSGYVASQRVRKRVEEVFGWMKTVGGGRKLRYIGLKRNLLWVEFTAAAYNLIRIANLCPEYA